MRGLRAILPIMAYLIVLGIFVLIQFNEYGGTLKYQDLEGSGRDLGFLLLYIQIFLVLILSPAYAASAITIEKERETFDVMQTTLLTSWDIVSGKVFSGFSYAVLLVMSSLPLLSLSFWMGGFDLNHLFWGFLIVSTCALVTTCVGIFLSTVVSRSYLATGVTYGVVLAAVGLSWLLNFILQRFYMSQTQLSSLHFGWDTIPMWLGFTLNPLFMMQALDQGDILFYRGQAAYYNNPLIELFNNLFGAFHLPYIAAHVLMSALLSALLILFASYFLFRSSREDNK
jgi:ABC-type transport system involved in multi-copper enzyme maturation permease subunit